MMKLTSILANSLVFFAAASLLIGCGVAGGEPFPTYRYRMAVEVDTPEGVRTGSSVIEVETTLSSKYTIPTPGTVNTTIHREAVAIDLKERGVLFATLRSEKDVDWARNIMFLLAPAAPRGVSDPFASRFKDMLGMKGPIELPRFLPNAGLFTGGRPGRPMLVRFGDLSDPTSVARVDADDLSKSFGNGVKLRRITVELTQQPVSHNIDNWLPWLERVRQVGLDPKKLPPDVADGDFAGLFERILHMDRAPSEQILRPVGPLTTRSSHSGPLWN